MTAKYIAYAAGLQCPLPWKKRDKMLPITRHYPNMYVLALSLAVISPKFPARYDVTHTIVTFLLISDKEDLFLLLSSPPSLATKFAMKVDSSYKLRNHPRSCSGSGFSLSERHRKLGHESLPTSTRHKSLSGSNLVLTSKAGKNLTMFDATVSRSNTFCQTLLIL